MDRRRMLGVSSGNSSSISRPMCPGDVAYWDGSSVKTISLNEYDSSLGESIGVVVIPEGFLPDGRARIISKQAMDSSGAANYEGYMPFGNLSGTDLDTSYFRTVIPYVDTESGEHQGFVARDALLPSDKFNDLEYVPDPKVYHYYSSRNISKGPSPYFCKTD
jgi:hypothetical protein